MIGLKTHHILPIFLAVPTAQQEITFPHTKTVYHTASDESLLGKHLLAIEFCELTHVGNTDRAPYTRQSVQVLVTARGMDSSGCEV